MSDRTLIAIIIACVLAAFVLPQPVYHLVTEWSRMWLPAPTREWQTDTRDFLGFAASFFTFLGCLGGACAALVRIIGRRI